MNIGYTFGVLRQGKFCAKNLSIRKTCQSRDRSHLAVFETSHCEQVTNFIIYEYIKYTCEFVVFYLQCVTIIFKHKKTEISLVGEWVFVRYIVTSQKVLCKANP